MSEQMEMKLCGICMHTMTMNPWGSCDECYDDCKPMIKSLMWQETGKDPVEDTEDMVTPSVTATMTDVSKLELGMVEDALTQIHLMRAVWLKDELSKLHPDIPDMSDEELQVWFDAKGYYAQYESQVDEHEVKLNIELWQKSGDLSGQIAKTTLTYKFEVEDDDKCIDCGGHSVCGDSYCNLCCDCGDKG